jgi:hypothetical protein
MAYLSKNSQNFNRGQDFTTFSEVQPCRKVGVLELKIIQVHCKDLVIWYLLHINEVTRKGEMTKVAKTGLVFETSILFSEFRRWKDYQTLSLSLSLSLSHTHTHTFKN